MKVRLNKLLSLVLAIAMVVGMLPAALAADETPSSTTVATIGSDKYPTLQAALDAIGTTAGDIQVGYITDNFNHKGYSAVCGEAVNVECAESFVVKMYCGDTLVGTAALNDPNFEVIGKHKEISWHAALTNDGDTYWVTEWVGGALKVDAIPDKVELYIDGVKTSEGEVKLNNADDSYPVVAAKVDANGVVEKFFTAATYVHNADYAAGLNAALDNGGNITLLRDVALTETLQITKPTTLDLNGKTITSTAKCAVQVSGGNADLAVTIRNGKIVGVAGTSKNQTSALSVYDGADVVVENVDLSGAYLGVKIAGANYTSDHTKNNCTSMILQGETSVTAENAAIIGLGQYPNTLIEINEGVSVTSEDSIAIYHPSYGTLNVKGGTITGATAIYLKAGNLNIEGGKIVANGEYADYAYNYSGASVTGDAIVIESCNYGGYPTPTAEITAGTVTSANNKAVASYHSEDADAVTGFVSGGTFSSDVSKLCAAGFTTEKNAEGTYGILAAKTYVARIGETKYETLAKALAAAEDGETVELLWTEGDAPISMAGTVCGNKTVTITGTATVDWSKDWLYVGRNGEGDGKVIFDNANLTSASNSNSYGINVSGSKKDSNTTNDGAVEIKDSTIVLDYLINKGSMTLDNATLTVKNGFGVGGRPGNETESGEDATATISLSNGSKLVVNNHNGMGLGYEAIGVMDIDDTSTFETTKSFQVTAKGTMNVNGGTVKVAGTLTNNGTIYVTGTADIAATVTGDGWVYMNGVTLSSATKLYGAKVRFASGTNTLDGSTIDDGWFQVGIGAYKGVDANVDTVNGVTVNVKNNAHIGAGGIDYQGWIGSGYYDTDAEKTAAMTGAKYVLNIENSLAEFGYLHISNDGVLNVVGDPDVKGSYNNDYSFYTGWMIVNGTATFDKTDVLALHTIVSNDNGTDEPGTLNIVNGTYYEAERHNGAVAGDTFLLKKTGVVNVNDAELYVGDLTSIAADAKLNIAGKTTMVGTVTNAGTIYVTGTSDIAATVTGDGWVYMNGVTLSSATKLYGAKVAFINGENKLVGSTITDGWFNVGIGQNAAADTAAAFAAANGITLGDVIVNVSGDAVIDANGATYSGWVGSAYSADKTQNKYTLNVENSLATFGYMHVSKDGTLNVKGHANNKYTYDNANVDFYAGDLIVNGEVTLDGTDAWVKFTKMSVDHADGVLNIVNGTNFESSIHNGSTSSTSLKFWQAGTINVDAASKVEIDNGTILVDGAALNIAGNVTAKGTVTGAGTITLTAEKATYTAPAELTVLSGLSTHKVDYIDGAYVLVEYNGVAVNSTTGKEFESVSAALAAAQSGETVKLVKTAEETSMIDIPTGVTLDLNGQMLTATYVFSTGDIVDSGEELGGLKYTRYAAIDPSNTYLPLYDAESSCYRFFAYRTRTGTPTVSGNKATFAFLIQLTDTAFAETGYKLLAANPEAVTLYIELSYGENTIDYKFKNETIKGHAEDWLGGATMPVITLTVNGLDSIKGETLSATPLLTGTLGTLKTGTATSFTVPAQ